jgi:tetratricopeptide (TPR) repeat protein
VVSDVWLRRCRAGRMLDVVARTGNDSVFISYAGRDLVWAEWMAWQLQDAGYRVELDRWDWVAGDNVMVRMNQALERADTVVAVVSEAYFEVERFTTDEWTSVLAARGRLVPLRVEDVRPIAILRPYLFQDLFGLAELQARQVLLQAVAGPAGPPPEPPTFPSGATAGPAPPAPAGPRLPGMLPPVWYVRPPRSAVFTGRDAMLGALRDAFAAGGRVYALHGIGGVGKTTLAVEYAYRFASGYELVWWIDADQPDRIGEQLAALAEAAGWAAPGTDVQTCATLAGRRLRSTTGWLLVFDNAEDPDAVVRWLPPGGAGHVVVTSRNPNWGQIATAMPVDVFASAESTILLRRLIPSIADQDAGSVADALGDLPLAVAQAAGVLTETGMTPRQYLHALADHTAEVLADGTPAGYPVSLAAAVGVAVERLEREDPAAVQLVRICAALAPEPIPVEQLFMTSPAGALPDPLATAARSTVALYRSVRRLGRYGLARSGDGAIHLHRLTQAILTATDLDPADTRRRVVVALLDAAFPSEIDDLADPGRWPYCADLLPHVLAAAHDANGISDVDVRAAALLRRAGTYLEQRGDYPASRKVLERALAMVETISGHEHIEVASVLDALGYLLMGQGDLETAREYLERALAINRSVLGGEDPAVGRTLNVLGRVVGDLGNLTYARENIESALTISVAARSLGPDNPQVASIRNNLGRVLRDEGDLAGARSCHERALEIKENAPALGPDHPTVGGTLDLLGRVIGEQGDLDGARRHLERSLAIKERSFGLNHRETAITCWWLGVVLRKLGDFSSAVSRLEHAATVLDQVYRQDAAAYGPDHPTVSHDLSVRQDVSRELDVARNLEQQFDR